MLDLTGKRIPVEEVLSTSKNFNFNPRLCLSLEERFFIATFDKKYRWFPREPLGGNRLKVTLEFLPKEGESFTPKASPVPRHKNPTLPVFLRESRGKIPKIVRFVRADRVAFIMNKGLIPPNCYLRPMNGNESEYWADNQELVLYATGEVINRQDNRPGCFWEAKQQFWPGPDGTVPDRLNPFTGPIRPEYFNMERIMQEIEEL